MIHRGSSVSRGSSSPSVPLTRTEAEGFMHVWTHLIPHLSTKSFSPREKIEIQEGRRQDGRQLVRGEWRWQDEEEKKRMGADIFLLAIFLLSFISLFLPLFVFVGSAYQIPAPFRASVRGRSQTPPSLFHSISLSLLLSRALPLLTFENKSLEFEFQSELASKRRVWEKEEEETGVSGRGGEACQGEGWGGCWSSGR